MCCYRNIFIPTPWKVIGNFKGEGGVSTAKIYKGNYEAKLVIPRSWEGLNEKTFHGWGRYGY